MFVDFSKYKFEVTGYELNNELDELILLTNVCSFKIVAVGDCCSCSRIYNIRGTSFDSLIGKIIKRVKEVDYVDEFVACGCNACDCSVCDCDDDNDVYVSKHVFKIEFVNCDEVFHFLMFNYSNGYYDGWISIDTCFK